MSHSGPALSLDDYEALARARLPRPLFAYAAGGTQDNRSLSGNRSAFDRIDFIPRVLHDVGERSAAVSLFGQEWSMPVGVAPVGLAAMMAYRADEALARTAAAERIPMILSATSLIPLEEIAAAAPGSWFQAYLPAERDWIDAMLDRVAAAAFPVLVLTVDLPVMGNREHLLRAGFATPLRPSPRLFWDFASRPRWLAGVFARTLWRQGMLHFENSRASRGLPILSPNAEREFGGRDRLDWAAFDHIRRRWKGRLLIKGVLHPEDAKLAKTHGADGIIVSNHGGRQLDGAIAPIEALPAVIDAVGDYPVMIDGGFRRGGDVLKALALGARLVFAGRPFLYAAAVGGGNEIRRAIRIMREEIDRDMALLGVTRMEELTRDHVRLRTGAGA